MSGHRFAFPMIKPLLLLAFMILSGCSRTDSQAVPVGSQAIPATDNASEEATTPSGMQTSNVMNEPSETSGVAPVATPDHSPNPSDLSASTYRGNSYALLIGCTTYDYLGEDSALRGPTNDVTMMQEVLIDKFGFDPESIHTLTEGEGSRGRPIKQNIMRELKHLADVAEEGNKIVMLLSGHGSQQPDNDFDNPADPEPDGLDEIFCPADIDFATTEENPFAKNALTDDEMREAIGAIRAKGAFVWVIVDACHSGSAIRGNEVYRQISPERLVGAKAVSAARSKASGGTRGIKLDDSEMDTPTEDGGLVAIYAAQAHEPTLEMMLPDKATDAEWRGLLTYTMIQVLTTAESPLSYRELVQRIHGEYVRGYGRLGPTPLIEGIDQDRQVLEQNEVPSKSRFLLMPAAGGTMTLNGGRLHGFTKDTILSVFPPAGTSDPEQLLGYVKISEAKLATSTVAPVSYNESPINAIVPAGAQVQTVEVHYGDLALRVSVNSSEFIEKGVSLSPVTAILRELENDPAQRIRYVEDSESADWFVRCSESGEYFLTPSEGWSKVPNETYFGPAPASDQTEWFRDRLSRISRVKSLLKLCDTSAKQAGGLISTLLGKRRSCDVRLKMSRFNPETEELEPINWAKEKWKLSDGTQILLNIENTGTESVDFSALFIDSKFGITPLFPSPGVVADNRIQPGQEYLLGPMQIESTTLGLEHLLVIATKAEGQPLDFTWLSQDSLEAAQRAANIELGNKRDDSLQDLLQQTLFSNSNVRGMKMADIDTTCLRVLSWQTMPREETAAPDGQNAQ